MQIYKHNPKCRALSLVDVGMQMCGGVICIHEIRGAMLPCCIFQMFVQGDIYLFILFICLFGCLNRNKFPQPTV